LLRRHTLAVPDTEGVRVPVPDAPTERVAVEDFVGVNVGLAVTLVVGVASPDTVVLIVVLAVTVLVKEAVCVREPVPVDVVEGVPVIDPVEVRD